MKKQSKESLSCISKIIIDKETQAQFALKMHKQANTQFWKDHYLKTAKRLESEILVFRGGYEYQRKKEGHLELSRSWWIKNFQNFI